MNRYIFDFGSDDLPDDEVTLCVEVPAEDEPAAVARLKQHLEARSGPEEPTYVPFVVNEEGLQFRFYFNRPLNSITIVDINDMWSDEVDPGSREGTA